MAAQMGRSDVERHLVEDCSPYNICTVTRGVTWWISCLKPGNFGVFPSQFLRETNEINKK